MSQILPTGITVKESTGQYQVRIVRRDSKNKRKEIRRLFTSLSEAKRFLHEARNTEVEETARSTCTLIEAAELARIVFWSGNKDEDRSWRRAELLCEFFGKDKLITAVRSTDLAAYITHMKDTGRKGSTINRRMAPLSKMWEAAAMEGLVSMSTKPWYKREKEPKGRIRWLFPDEEKKIHEWFIDHGRYELAAHLTFSIDTGLRTMESLVVDHQHVTPTDEGEYGLWVEPISGSEDWEDDWFSKNAQSRVVPITDRTMDIIQARRNHSPIFEDVPYHIISYWWAKVREELFDGDKGITSYVTRHTCASRLVQQKMHLKDIQKWMGHTKSTTTERYAKNSSHDIKHGKAMLERYHT